MLILSKIKIKNVSAAKKNPKLYKPCCFVFQTSKKGFSAWSTPADISAETMSLSGGTPLAGAGPTEGNLICESKPQVAE